jgi:predicted esterase
MRQLLTVAVVAVLQAQELQHQVIPGAPNSPMIIFLHGTGGGTGAWGQYVNAAKAKGYTCVIPVSTGNGAGDPKSGNQGDNQRRWADVDVPKLVALAKDIQKKHGCDPKRTFIAGFSNGGFYAFEAALRHPEVFSAVLCMGAGCNVFDFSEAAKNVGCYIVHGTADTSVKFESGKKSSERLKAAGFRDVVFKEKPNGGHIVFPDEIEPFFTWLSKQKRRVTLGSIAWPTDLDAALKSGKRVIVYLYSPKDDNDWFETDGLVDKTFVEAASKFACVKINRDETTVPELKAKKTCVLVLDDKLKILAKFETNAPMAPKLKTLR